MNKRRRKYSTNTFRVNKAGRSYRRKKMWRNVFWLGGATLLLLVSCMSVALLIKGFLQRTVYKNEKYALKSVVVYPQDYNLRQEVLKASGVKIRDNLMRMDIKKIHQNIIQLPFVEGVSVSRRPPSQLEIRINERRAVAKIRGFLEGKQRVEMFYLDEHGNVMRGKRAKKRLPQIALKSPIQGLKEGFNIERPDIMRALHLLRVIEMFPSDMGVDRVDLSEPPVLKVRMTQGTMVLFRPDFFYQQVKRLSKVLEYEKINELEALNIDLTPSVNVPVKFNSKNRGEG